MSEGPETQEAVATEEEVPAPTREELWERCGEVGADEDILARLAGDAERIGYAGPTAGLRLTYLAATTRLFARPVSVALRGPSSAGKSFTIKQALAFLPEEASIELTAMSDKALVYLDEDLRHKVLVVYEGAGLSGDFLAYAIRTLLSEGRLDYAYTDFEQKKTVRVTKEGPTGLITSTAGAIDFELATRIITPAVEDTPALTRAILRAEAQAVQGPAEEIDYGPYHDLQRFIELGAREVIVPFAGRLAEIVDDKAVRMRRDFSAILCLVQASALLHQHRRETDEQGRILATVADYAGVYELVAEMVAEAAGSAVPKSVRETVEAVRKLERPPPEYPGVTQTVWIPSVAKQLGVNRSSASRRLKRAEGLGYVKEVTNLPGRAKMFETAEVMPGDTPVLPPPETLE